MPNTNYRNIQQQLLNTIIQSSLSDNQIDYLLLKILEVLNQEIMTADNTCGNLRKKSAPSDELKKVRGYQKDICRLQNAFANHLEKVFENLCKNKSLSPTQLQDCKDHYINRSPLEEIKSDRSTLQKTLRFQLRGFSGSVRKKKQINAPDRGARVTL